MVGQMIAITDRIPYPTPDCWLLRYHRVVTDLFQVRLRGRGAAEFLTVCGPFENLSAILMSMFGKIESINYQILCSLGPR
jgi:hypothetical protein